MSTRPHRDTRPPQRYEDHEIARPRSSSSMSPINAPPSPSISPSSSISLRALSATPTTSNAAIPDVRANSCTSQPSYRHDLLRNGIEIDPEHVSTKVLDYSRKILNRARKSPGLSEKGAQAIVTHMRHLRRSSDENAVKEGYLQHGIIPGVLTIPGVARGSDCPLDTTALPRAPMAPPLAIPKPDYYYSFSEDNFSNEQDAKQSSRTLRPYSRPGTTGSWPFFVVEFKSQARGGTFWVAENQAATSGSLCVKSIERLFSLVGDETMEVDSIVFSCIMDAKSAAFWVHYCNQDRDRYFSVEVEQFQMGNDKDVIFCHDRIQNIMSWACDTRLPKILQTLDSIQLATLQQQDKSQRARRSSASTDDTSSKRRAQN